jgi:chromosome segregation ATPase
MLRILLISVVLIPLIIALGGCSVFGVATKNELEAAMSQQSVAQRETEARVTELTERLGEARDAVREVEKRLEPRLTALDSAMARTEQTVDRATQQWQSVQALLAADLDSVRAELAGISGEVAAMQRGVDAMRQGMTSVRAQATSAQVRSREALRQQYEDLERERALLLGQLQDLEARLAAWPALTDSLDAIAPAGGADAGAATPEPGAGEPQGTVDIRPAIEPEQDATPPGP